MSVSWATDATDAEEQVPREPAAESPSHVCCQVARAMFNCFQHSQMAAPRASGRARTVQASVRRPPPVNQPVGPATDSIDQLMERVQRMETSMDRLKSTVCAAAHRPPRGSAEGSCCARASQSAVAALALHPCIPHAPSKGSVGLGVSAGLRGAIYHSVGAPRVSVTSRSRTAQHCFK